jgi:hypothetical protein
MPIHCPISPTRISQEEFKQLASEVMHHIFAIHNEFGRLFDEAIYKKELADRMSGGQHHAAHHHLHDIDCIAKKLQSEIFYPHLLP